MGMDKSIGLGMKIGASKQDKSKELKEGLEEIAGRFEKEESDKNKSEDIKSILTALGAITGNEKLQHDIGEENARQFIQHMSDLQRQLNSAFYNIAHFPLVLETNLNKLGKWLNEEIQKEQKHESSRAHASTLSKIGTLISSALKVIKYSFGSEKSDKAKVEKHKKIISQVRDELIGKSHKFSAGLENIQKHNTSFTEMLKKEREAQKKDTSSHQH